MLHLISAAQQRTTVPASIKVVQLIPKTYHDTVKQKAAEGRHEEYDQLIPKWAETRYSY
jgi:hypothetical protein